MTDIFNALAGLGGYGAIAFAAALLLASRFLSIAWGAVAMTVAFGVLGATFVAQREITSTIRQDFSAYKADQASAWQKQAEMTASTYRAAKTAQASIWQASAVFSTEADAREKENQDVLKKTRVAAAAAAARNASLHDQLTTIADAYRSARDRADATATSAAGLKATAATVGVLTDMLGKCGEERSAIAGFADEAHASGLACEREYEAARKALSTKAVHP